MPSRRLKVSFKDHYHESLPFARALSYAGHELVPMDADDVDVFFIDLDPPLAGYRKLIDYHSSRGAKVALYPHGGGGPVFSYDGLWEPYERIDMNFVTGVGQAEFLRRLDYPTAVNTVGWSFCEMRPFQARTDVRNVLFAPTHPNADGSMLPQHRENNAAVFAKLLDGPWQLTVRHVGTLEQIGLWEAGGVEFVNGHLRAQTAEIDVTDAVVAGEGTFPTLSMARGVPTVVYSQGITGLGLPGEKFTPLRRAHLYTDYSRYPFDALDGPLPEIVHAAARSDEPIEAWRRRYVGRPFNPGEFAALVERLADHTPAPHIDETRRFTTLALADELAEHPQLLRDYVEAVRRQDDASLVLWAPGLAGPQLLELAEAAIDRAGVDEDALPDVLLAPLAGGPATTAALADRADAVLSDWPGVGPIGKLPRFSGLPVTV
jgi:hypothetical protein